MFIVATVKELKNQGIFEEACRKLDLPQEYLDQGFVTEIKITMDEAEMLGLIKRPVGV